MIANFFLVSWRDKKTHVTEQALTWIILNPNISTEVHYKAWDVLLVVWNGNNLRVTEQTFFWLTINTRTPLDIRTRALDTF